MKFKKLAFCGTCAVVLLGIAPKMVAGKTMKSEMATEKKKRSDLAETKVDDSTAKLINLITLTLKYSLGTAGAGIGISILESMRSEKAKKERFFSSIFVGLSLTTGGLGAMIWAIKETFGPLFKQADTEDGEQAS